MGAVLKVPFEADDHNRAAMRKTPTRVKATFKLEVVKRMRDTLGMDDEAIELALREAEIIEG